MKLNKKQITFGILRISLGWIFLWAFLDKLFGLRFATQPQNAWIAGGSPTTGFLSNATSGPLEAVFKALANSALVDWIFMLGLLGIGISLIFGLAKRIGTISAIAMMILMYIAQLPLTNNPFMNDYIVYSLVFILFNFVAVEEWLGFGKWWKNTKLVKKFKFLK